MQLSIFDTQPTSVNNVKPLLGKENKSINTSVGKISEEKQSIETRVIPISSKEIIDTNQPTSLITVEKLEAKNGKELGDYAEYVPQISVKGAKDHPTPLCESLAMSSIKLPSVDYVPNLPDEVIKSGMLSNAQLEDIILAGHSHSQFIHNNEYRQGFMIGSGTGFGKGNTIAGIILDNFRQGRTKALWVSKNDKAHLNSLDYWKDVGGNINHSIDHRKFKPKDKIYNSKGLLLTTYGILRSGFQKNEIDGVTIVEGRVKQIIDWLGLSFDGLIVFDESHVMSNAIDQKGDRGVTKGSIVAQVGLTLQRMLPKARIVYSSATGATEVQNLVYADRLGLYGPGTSFPQRKDFINEIQSSGVTAMELIARDVKSLGLYTAKSLSYQGVEYDTITHNISDSQRDLYNHLARAWQKVLQNIEDAVEVNNTSKNAKAAAMSSFWSTHQRFFNLIILTIQFPTVAKDIQNELDNGNSIIIQLTNTNEAQTKRALANAKGKDINSKIDFESLDISPKSMLIEYLENSFPVIQFETYTDIDGNEDKRAVLDSEGNNIYNQDSLNQRDILINSIKEELHIPQGPLDTFISTFGAENIAEVTGRTIRLIDKEDPITGEIQKVEQRRTPAHSKSEIQDFLNDKRRILIFSEAGGTGGSFHADKRILNQRRRMHYAYQLGWRADIAVQGFGRSHRSNQVCPPKFKLCSTNINAQKRFLSSIARRLEQLGALTKGQRTTGGQGILDNSYNFESSYAKDALQLLYYDILHKSNPISMDQLQSMMGLKLMTTVDGVEEINKDLIQDIKKFLNRILSLEIEVMNRVFMAFENKMKGLINQAKLSGSYDEGITHIKSKSTQLIEEIPIFKHEKTGAEAILTTLKLDVKVDKRDWSKITEMSHTEDFIGFFEQNNSGKIYAAFFAYNTTDPNGDVTEYISRVGVSNESMFDSKDFYNQHVRVLDDQQSKHYWNIQYEETPETKEELHSLIKGLLLPIWKQIPGDNIVHRYIDDSGNTHLGRFITQSHLPHVRSLFKLSNNLSIPEIIKKLNNNYTLELSNGIKLRKTTIQSIPSIEFSNVNPSYLDQLESYGMIIRIKNKLLEIKTAHLPKTDLLEKLPIIMKNMGASVTNFFSNDDETNGERSTVVNDSKPRKYSTKEEVLADCTLNSNMIRLPKQKLDRHIYLEVKNELQKIGGQWKGGKIEAFTFMYDPIDSFMKLRKSLSTD